MKYYNIYDTHIHSIHSFDGNHSCSQLCESAIKRNAKGICITDHCDIDMKDYDFDALVKNQFEDIELAKKRYGDKLEIMFGIELGQGIYLKEKSLDIISRYNYDFILGSIHNLENMQDFYFLDFKNESIDELLTRYFNDLLLLVKWNKIDSLAHLTYPLRYIYERENIVVDLSKYDEIITQIFSELINNEKALELNVSGLFMPISETLPSADLIKKYHDMGGKYVTIGSDAHYCEKVCNGVEEGLDILKSCGFESYTIYKNRKPILIPIK